MPITDTTGVQPESVVDAGLCSSCGTVLVGEFCHYCGEKRTQERDLTLKHFAAHGLHELTHLDSKIFATVRYLFSKPGFLTQEFVAGRRSLYMKPLSLFLAAVALLFLMDSFIPRSVYDVEWIMRADKSRKFDLLLEKLAAKKRLPKEILVERIQSRIHKISEAMQFANVLVLAGILALLYRKRYFVEHLVFAFHFLSFDYLGAVLLRPIAGALGVENVASTIWSVAVSLMLLTYLFLAQRRFYGQGRGITWLKAFVAVLVTQAVLIFTAVITLFAGIIAAAKS
jgi:hypothetical protein